jgi:hypothetical protein
MMSSIKNLLYYKKIVIFLFGKKKVLHWMAFNKIIYNKILVN